MSGSAGPECSGQSAGAAGRSSRAGASRLAGVLASALFLIAGLLAAAWVGVSPAAATATPVWTQLSSSGPSARYGPAMAYDPANSQFVLFGGQGLTDTWTWNGSTWTQLSPAASPPARWMASMAYDPATSQFVLFGGDSTSGELADTWTWNGSTWSQLSPAQSPPARNEASMAYDPAIGQLVLFGGYGNSGLLGDTWTWNGSTWSQLSPAQSPPARNEASMAYDPVTSQLVLFGGTGSSGKLADTWTWTGGTGGTWTLLSPAQSPPARQLAAMAYDPDISQLVLFGGTGLNIGYLGDTWTWDGSTWSQLFPVPSPAGRTRLSMAYDPAASQLVLFGGTNGIVGLDDTWTFAVPTPSPVPPTTTITQAWPVTGTTTPGAWAGFTSQLSTTGQRGWTRYVTTSKGCGVAVSASGKITTTRWFTGRCTVSGTDSDTGTTVDAGTWSYTLTAGAVVISQRGPWTATTTTAASAGFRAHFRTNGGRGPVSYVTTSKACGLAVSRAGAIWAAGHLKPGHCTVSGTDTDTTGSRGRWTFTLTISRGP
jgi:galactose oxidase-like protein